MPEQKLTVHKTKQKQLIQRSVFLPKEVPAKRGRVESENEKKILHNNQANKSNKLTSFNLP